MPLTNWIDKSLQLVELTFHLSFFQKNMFSPCCTRVRILSNFQPLYSTRTLLNVRVNVVIKTIVSYNVCMVIGPCSFSSLHRTGCAYCFFYSFSLITELWKYPNFTWTVFPVTLASVYPSTITWLTAMLRGCTGSAANRKSFESTASTALTPPSPCCKPSIHCRERTDHQYSHLTGDSGWIILET